MVWFQVDDGLTDNPKALSAGDEALGLWVRLGAYCSKQGTDGFVSQAIVDLHGTPKKVKALLISGLWLKVDGGFQMHDFLDYNRSKRVIAEKREADRERQRVARESKARSNGVTTDVAGDSRKTHLESLTANPGKARDLSFDLQSKAEPFVGTGAVQDLIAALKAANFTFQWDKLTDDHRRDIESLVEKFGITRIVAATAEKWNRKDQTRYGHTLIGLWQGIPEHRPRPVTEFCDDPEHFGQIKPCVVCRSESRVGVA